MTKDVTSTSRSFSDWLCYLEQQHPSEIELGLTRIAQVAQRGELTHFSGKVITVAGTNGKGSTCALLEQVLLKAGYRVGVYSSPHLLDYCERVRIDGTHPSQADFCQSFAAIDRLRHDISLTYFEYATLSALYLFQQQALDFIILEVGLGGRLDATNIVDPDVAVVTTVALDHVDWLGDDLAGIGREKAGIFRQQGKVVIGDPQMVASVAEQAQRLNCNYLQAGQHYQLNRASDSWSYQGPQLTYDDLPFPQLPVVNAATVCAVLEQLQLKLSKPLFAAALAEWQLAGRMQTIQSDPLIMVDVAHNPQSAAYLAAQLQAKYAGKQLIALCAMLGDKDVPGTLAPLMPIIDQWHIAGLAVPRGDDGSLVAKALVGKLLHRYTSVKEAYQALQAQLSQDQVLIVFGSFYTVAGVLEFHSQLTHNKE